MITCWDVFLTNGARKSFTNSDTNLEIEGAIYTADLGIEASVTECKSSIASDNINVDGLCYIHNISEEDLRNNLYDNAKVDVFLYDATTRQKHYIQSGYFGKVVFNHQKFNVELCGLEEKLNGSISKQYSPTCRARFCDAACKVNSSLYTDSFVVSKVLGRRKIAVDASLYDNDKTNFTVSQPYQYGKLTFTTGSNKNLSREVMHHNKHEITIFQPFPFDFIVGDEFELTAGCDKLFSTCVNKFNNAVNFRGEPHLPERKKFVV